MGDLLNSVNDIVGQSSDQGSGLSQDLSQNIALANQQPGTSGGAPVGGFWQNFGQTLALPAKDILLGAKQHVLDPLTNAVNNALPDWVQAKLTEANKNLGLAATPEEAQKNTNKLIEDTRKYYADVLKTPGGQAGYATGTIGTALAGGTTLKLAGLPELGAAVANPSTFGQAAATGAALGGLQPTVGDENALANAGQGALWGLAGQGAVKGLSAVAHPVEDALSDIGKKAVQTLKDAGIPLDAAQTTGSALLHRVKASLSDNPITAGGQSAFSQMQQAAYNKAVAKTMGEDATAITPDIIQSAKDRIGKVYDSVADRTGIHVTPDYQQGFQDILGDARMQLNDQQYAILDRNVNDIMNKANMNGGFINGDQYKNIKQALDGISKSPDTQVGEFARDLRDYVNKGLSDTANIMGDTQAVQDLKTANRQWGNMRKVEDVTIGKNAEGDVSPARLYSSLGAKNKRYSFYQDDPQLAELAQAGKLILPNQVPNSGTVARMMAQGLLSAGTPAAITGAATGLYQGDWGSALKGAVAGAALPKVVQYGMNNPRFVQYLAEGLPNNNIRNLLNVPQAIGAQRIPLSLISAQKQSQQ